MKTILKSTLIAFLLINLSACIVTDVITKPLRIVGTAVSLIPIVGSIGETVIDITADAIDAVGDIADSMTDDEDNEAEGP